MSDLTHVFETENTKDDDGKVIDSFFIEVDNAPDLKPAIEPIPTPAVQQPKKPTKILSSQLVVDPTWTQPQMILPFDDNRRGLTIKVVSPTSVATDGVKIMSDPGLASASGILFHGQTLSDAFMEHTGPLYVQGASLTTTTPGALSASVVVQVWAVTY